MISVVIPTYNRQEFLKKCLDSILQVDYFDYEIIVVNDGSTDGTEEFLKNYNKKYPQLKFINLDKNYGPSVARNEGIKIAQGEIIAFTDDDCIVDKEWLKEISTSFLKNDCIGVSGVTYYKDAINQYKFPHRVISLIKEVGGTGNTAYYKNYLIKIGGFDPFFKRFQDVDLFFTMIKYGKIIKSPSAIVYHQKEIWTLEKILKLSSAPYYYVWVVKKHGKKVCKKQMPHYFYSNFILLPKDYLKIVLSFFLFLYDLIKYLMRSPGFDETNIKMLFFHRFYFPLARRYYIWKAAWEAKIFLI